MRRTGLLRRWLSNLFVLYAAASLVPVVLLGLVLIHGYQGQALRRGLEQGRAQAAVIQQMAIAPALHGNDLSHGLTASERERLQSATDLAIFNGSVSRLRLRSFSGQVTFSDDGSTAGALSTSHPAFRAAAAGRTTVTIVRDPQAGRGQLIRVLQPIVANTSGRATGVFEVYLPYDQIAAEVQVQTRHTVWQLATGLAGLYMVLALIAWYTTRRLHRHAAEQTHQALHDSLTGLPNREWFRARAEEALGRAEEALARSESSAANGAMVLVDLDRFQGGQRHPRPPRRRRAAAGRRTSPARGAAHRRRCRPSRWRRVRPAPARRHRGICPTPAACRPAGLGRGYRPRRRRSADRGQLRGRALPGDVH